MQRMVIVIFDDESKAYEGRRRLLQLDSDGEIRVKADAVLVKQPDGSATVKEQEAWPLGALISAALGSLIGVLGGPMGVVTGATAGFAAGGIADLTRVGISEEFVDDVSRTLLPNRGAVVAEIEEGDTTSVDIAMEALGGVVFRRTLLNVMNTVHHGWISAIKARLSHLRTGHAHDGSESR